MSKECLEIYLSGPMCSWGPVAIGSFRGSELHPTKSAIVGLLSASLGIDRDDVESQKKLSSGYEYVVVANDSMSKIQDYHTIFTGPEPHTTEMFGGSYRKTELKREKMGAIISTREYVCNGYYTIFILPKDNAEWTLLELKDAVSKPKYIPYLGRKSCPASFPLCPNVARFDRLYDLVVKDSMLPFRTFVSDEKYFDRLKIFSTFELENEFTGISKRRKQDEIEDREYWSFGSRNEYEYMVNRE